MGRIKVLEVAILAVVPLLLHAQVGFLTLEARATRIYDRHSDDAEKRMALETWNRALTGIVTAKPKQGAAVVAIKGRR